MKLCTILQIMLLSGMLLFTGCATQPGGTAADPGVTTGQQDMIPLPTAYSNIFFNQVIINPEYRRDYPHAPNQVLYGALAELRSLGKYANVEQNAGRKYPGKTVIVEVKITDMRIVSGLARGFGGVFAGSSYMNLDVKLIDAQTKQVIRTKELSTSNNPFGAEWTGGATDVSLPGDMGHILGQYLNQIIPAQNAPLGNAAG